jgi:hypothetical protein
MPAHVKCNSSRKSSGRALAFVSILGPREDHAPYKIHLESSCLTGFECAEY